MGTRNFRLLKILNNENTPYYKPASLSYVRKTHRIAQRVFKPLSHEGLSHTSMAQLHLCYISLFKTLDNPGR